MKYALDSTSFKNITDGLSSIAEGLFTTVDCQSGKRVPFAGVTTR